MSEWNKPDDPPATGHAAVGFVFGQEFRGEKPKKVLVRYLDEDGSELEASILRDSYGIQQVEYDDTDNVRFLFSDYSTLEVAGIVAAKPVIGSVDAEEIYE